MTTTNVAGKTVDPNAGPCWTCLNCGHLAGSGDASCTATAAFVQWWKDERRGHDGPDMPAFGDHINAEWEA